MSILGESKVPTESFISGKDLEAGIVVEVAAAPEVIDQPEDTPDMYKTGDGNGLVKAEIIKPGQTMRYRFLLNGEESMFDNSSYAFYKELYRLNPDAGQPFQITRTGEGTSTKYKMEFVGEQPTVASSEDVPFE